MVVAKRADPITKPRVQNKDGHQATAVLYGLDLRESERWKTNNDDERSQEMCVW